MTILVGDVHGKYGPYKNIIKKYPNTIALGDLGIGFMNFHGDLMTNPPYDQMVESNARFIRGNHDNPAVCRRHTQFIQDGTIEGNTMFIGGAWSIDSAYRIEGQSWWADEQLSYQELDEMIDKAMANKPEVMVTHDFPEEMVHYIFEGIILHKDKISTRTGQALERIRQLVKPKLWIGGHWHVNRDITIDGTRFICLAELACRDINLETLKVSDVMA